LFNQWVIWLLYAGLWLTLTLTGLGISTAVTYKPSRLRKLPWGTKRGKLRLHAAAWQERLAGGKSGVEATGRMLKLGGMNMPVPIYLTVKHAIITLSIAATAGLTIVDSFMRPLNGVWAGYAICALLFAAAYADHVLLQLIASRRKQRITEEIYIICRQLLYYKDSRMNLHSKLMRCQPFIRVLNGAFRRLLNGWYESPELALKAFKEELSTAEAYSFAESLNTMRLGENERYYKLLEERAMDYKDKLEIAKDSLKETRSYVLFLLAGIPILNTFWVFLYPWVKEGEQLFYHLH